MMTHLRRIILVTPLLLNLLYAADQAGEVRFNGLPVPGATVTLSSGERAFQTTSGLDGQYVFHDVAEGEWRIRLEMRCFETIEQAVAVRQAGAPERWALRIIAPSQTVTAAESPAGSAVESKPAVSDATNPEAANPEAADSFIIEGSANNGTVTKGALSAAFGNHRSAAPSPYRGNAGLILDNSTLDARQYSLTGQRFAKPDYNRMTGIASIGGPLRIPGLVRNGPSFVISYQRFRSRDSSLASALVPDVRQRAGDLTGSAPFADPPSGESFAGSMIPASRLSPQAEALLKLYPLPNIEGSTRFNYQAPLIGSTHQDNLQARADRKLSPADQISLSADFQTSRSDRTSMFSFVDRDRSSGVNVRANWRHSWGARMALTTGVEFSRLSLTTIPYFAHQVNVSGEAGIQGNNQDSANWGPPRLSFASGLAELSDSAPSLRRNQTSGASLAMTWNHGRHNVRVGSGYRWRQLNSLAQDDPRGTFTFNGQATALQGRNSTGSDFAGFLLGIPDTSSIAFGNADKYFRTNSSDVYVTDDWRVGPGLTLNAGVRWEYTSPLTERYGRLVNLAIAPGFTSATPVIAAQLGEGRGLPPSLVRPDRIALQPRVALAWRPVPGSSLVIRAGYGTYYDTSVLQTLAPRMAQQPPLSTTGVAQSVPGDLLSLADGFRGAGSLARNTFAVDPDFRVGYAQNWQLSLQRDLPAGLVLSATYLGIKGTRGPQQFLPNTSPSGALNPCSSCPAGFLYVTSNGNSTREAGQLQVRRRLKSGVAVSLLYTWSKSLDDTASLSGGQGILTTAQNWLNLSAERGLSGFDQRHVLGFQTQFSSDMGAHRVALHSPVGSVLRSWTLTTDFNVGSGLPLNPVFPASVSGTGFTGSIRPDFTGAPLYSQTDERFLNPAAFRPPASGAWGNAARNSITGPNTFGFNASLGRTFRWTDRLNADFRIDSTNVLNRGVFPGWNTVLGSAQFGLPTSANPMRSVQSTLRVRF